MLSGTSLPWHAIQSGDQDWEFSKAPLQSRNSSLFEVCVSVKQRDWRFSEIETNAKFYRRQWIIFPIWRKFSDRGIRNQFKRLISINSTKSSQPWNLLNVRFEYEGAEDCFTLLRSFAKQLSHFAIGGRVYKWKNTIYMWGWECYQQREQWVDINLPWNEASDRLMHIGMWIRIVGQLYEPTQQNGADLSLSVVSYQKPSTIFVLLGFFL